MASLDDRQNVPAERSLSLRIPRNRLKRTVNGATNRTGLGPGWGALSGINFFHWRSSRAIGSSPDILIRIWVRSLASTLSHRTDVIRPERKLNT